VERQRSVRELLEIVAARLSTYLGDTFVVSLLTDGGRLLHPVGPADPDPEVGAMLDALAGVRWTADEGFSRPELAAYAERFGISSSVVAPMRLHGTTVGRVVGLRRRAGAAFTAADEALVQSVADWLALAVQCAGPQALATPAAGSSEAAGGLTPREREVLALIALGHTNREAAERLVLSVRTVEWHRARIQWKLGVTGRAALAAAARRHGLLE
jgi:DNA-binding CsgD family transcriptional regulator